MAGTAEVKAAVLVEVTVGGAQAAEAMVAA